ncbi:MAG: P1 family peptidase [Chloroflexi bacterium]|nr:P1 family peptidase [Chloroflexota bacterium]
MTMPESRPRARDLGLHIGPFSPGPHNAITDVPGIRVGHITLISGDGPLRIGHGPVRTGVTAIVPPGDDWYAEPVEAGNFVFNGAGTTTGLSLIDEYGRIETPVLLTNTLSVGAVYEGIVRYMVQRTFAPRGVVPWFNPVVGETADGFLNDIGGLHVRPEHAVEAIDVAATGDVEEGAVGAGTGTGAFGFKGGIGTSSRVVDIGGEQAVIATLVQSNFGGRLSIDGVPMADVQRSVGRPAPPAAGASLMMIVATDLPLSNRLLNRLSKRATLGMARTGSSGGHASGDYVIAFSTTYRAEDAMPLARREIARNEQAIDIAFGAVADATEEAILNSLFRAHTVVGADGNALQALPIEPVVDRLRQAGRL